MDNSNATHILMSVNEICSYLHKSRNTVYKLLRHGKIKSIKNGNRYFVTKENVNRFITGENDD